MGALLRSTRDVSAVSGLCAMVDRVAWDKVGGWSGPVVPTPPSTSILFLRLGRAGYRVVYTPEVPPDSQPCRRPSTSSNRWTPIPTYLRTSSPGPDGAGQKIAGRTSVRDSMQQS